MHINIVGLICFVAGIVLFVWGLRIVFSRTFYEESESSRNFEDSALDKRLLSPKTRYFIGRYLSGTQALGAGLGLMLFGVLLQFVS
jgi:hypothetical protein